MDKTSSFIADVLMRVSRPRIVAGERLTPAGFAVHVLVVAVETLAVEVRAPVEVRSSLAFRDRLIEIAAVACRAARDLEIEGAADAAEKDIPF